VYKVPVEGVYKVPADLTGLSWSLDGGKHPEKVWMEEGGKSQRCLDEKRDRTPRSWLSDEKSLSRSWLSDEKCLGDQSPVTTPRLPPLPDFDKFLFDMEETDVDQDEPETNVDDDQDELVPVYANVDC